MIGECFDYARQFTDGDHDGLDPYVRFVSSQLFIDCHLTSESVLILIREGKEWDADLLNRAVMEGSLKYAYMLLGDVAEIKRKAQEYWEILPDFAAVTRSERAKRFLKDADDPGDSRWKPLADLVLADEQVTIARRGLNRPQRQALEERWSFSGVSKEFLRRVDNG